MSALPEESAPELVQLVQVARQLPRERLATVLSFARHELQDAVRPEPGDHPWLGMFSSGGSHLAVNSREILNTELGGGKPE